MAIAQLSPRQIWANPTTTSTALPRHCTPFRLPSGGFLAVGDTNTITLTQEAVFQPHCTSESNLNITIPSLESPLFDEKDPFYASTLPQMYAIAAVTVVSYLLVIILFITPRTFFIGGSGGGGGFLGQRGMISGASGSSSVIGVGGRPWLQKVAALTVAISLTIASVDTFRVAERQYAGDFSDASALTSEVVSSLELRIVRVVSETCLWLAQAQTLIRLFPRHKEKVIIKWAGFVLIGLDTIFSILNYFVSSSSRSAPRKFQDAVPALSYLFTFCLSLIYAAWIIYYSLSKRRYAFFHPKMRNICLVALLSYVAVLIPVVFFILDISIFDVAAWGNYVRWVGAAAASVVVWEWVERIEALERDERKDGILGREIFDGDEMLEVTPSSAMTWSSSRRVGGTGGSGPSNASSSNRGFSSVARRFNRRRQTPKQRPNRPLRHPSSFVVTDYRITGGVGDNTTSPIEPISQSNLPSSMSTSPPIRQGNRSVQGHLHPISDSTIPENKLSDSTSGSSTGTPDNQDNQGNQNKSDAITSVAKTLWGTIQKIPIPFLNRHMSPPIEVKQAVRSSQQPTEVSDGHYQIPSAAPAPAGSFSILDKMGLKKTAPAPKAPLPVTIVPAPPRNNTAWTDVRFHAESAPLPRPLSHNEPRRTNGADIMPTDQLSRRSTPMTGAGSNRYSPAPSQAYRVSRELDATVEEPADASATAAAANGSEYAGSPTAYRDRRLLSTSPPLRDSVRGSSVLGGHPDADASLSTSPLGDSVRLSSVRNGDSNIASPSISPRRDSVRRASILGGDSDGASRGPSSPPPDLPPS
ncbi:MAG: hypothetical protein Q9222_003157 [Ikaeria aurantiellina]